MLNRYQFEALYMCAQKGECDGGGIREEGVSDQISKELNELYGFGYVDKNGQLTPEGSSALAPYAVDNAVILAAGMATRFAPLSFEKPKAMFEVRGEVLIERLIRQLREVGINDVTVVVGYMKEAFFYLEDVFGVNIVVNPDYANRNNHSSLWCARHIMGNTYVVSSDQYFTCNVFSKYNYTSYCSACFSEGYTDERVLVLDDEQRVVGFRHGGEKAFIMQGPAYLDREFSCKYLKYLGQDYEKPETIGKLWEQVFFDHASKLQLLMKPLASGTVFEFDYITDLVAFDRDFFANVDSRILENICETLDCLRDDITEIEPISAGLTNLSTLFVVKGEKYIYRHPGNGTEEVVNRKGEVIALEIARELGLDDTYVYEDPSEGWKISRFIEGCSELDYADRRQVQRALQMVRTLHTSGKESPYSFDFFDEGAGIVHILQNMGYPLPKGFDELAGRVKALAVKMRSEAGDAVLCHNDFYGPNLLVKGEEMRLIDWEYAAMGDQACDIGNFVAQGSGYSVEEALNILPLYFGREPTDFEKRHCIAAVGLVGWYWYVWAMYKEAMGNPVGEWLYVWHRAAKQFTAAAEKLYAAE